MRFRKIHSSRSRRFFLGNISVMIIHASFVAKSNDVGAITTSGRNGRRGLLRAACCFAEATKVTLISRWNFYIKKLEVWRRSGHRRCCESSDCSFRIFSKMVFSQLLHLQLQLSRLSYFYIGNDPSDQRHAELVQHGIRNLHMSVRHTSHNSHACTLPISLLFVRSF